MSRAPTTFRQGDVQRAIKATKLAGLPISRVEIDKAGKIVVVVGEATKNDELDRELTEWRHANNAKRNREGHGQG